MSSWVETGASAAAYLFVDEGDVFFFVRIEEGEDSPVDSPVVPRRFLSLGCRFCIHVVLFAKKNKQMRHDGE